MDADLTGPLPKLIAALLIGFLIGLDRERAEIRKQRPIFAGVRTFPLIALAGALSILLLETVGPWLVIACFLTVAGVALISYLRTSAAGDVGATTEVAAIATFLLGSLAGTGQLALAAAAGVAVAVLLAAKPRLERFTRALTSEEVSATLELAVITVIVLPLLPATGYGPGEVLNPRDIWLVVVLVCALSFAGFVATRLLGQKRGLLVYGMAGGLVSSTAVTLAMARRSRAAPETSRLSAAAAVLASGIMSLRMLFFASTINAGMLPRLAPSLLAMALAAAILAPLLQRGTAPAPPAEAAPMPNPFSLKEALAFAAIYTLILVVLHAAGLYLGPAGTYAVAAAGSLADVDAVTIALARAGPLAAGGWRDPVAAVTLAAIVNTAAKGVIALAAGSGRFRALAGGALAVMGAAGIAVGLALYLAFR
jgi:uncharacterized membrane protein (DUF4010 family)